MRKGIFTDYVSFDRSSVMISLKIQIVIIFFVTVRFLKGFCPLLVNGHKSCIFIAH